MADLSARKPIARLAVTASDFKASKLDALVGAFTDGIRQYLDASALAL